MGARGVPVESKGYGSALMGGIMAARGKYIGSGISLFAVGDWGVHSFGSLEPTKVLRRVIPAVTAMMLGGEIVLSSFFFSVLG